MGKMTHVGEHIFRMGWFNHQLENQKVKMPSRFGKEKQIIWYILPLQIVAFQPILSATLSMSPGESMDPKSAVSWTRLLPAFSGWEVYWFSASDLILKVED